MQVSINVKPDIIKRIDDARGMQSRSAFIVGCVVEHFTPTGEADKNRIMRLENEIEYLRQEYSKINDALAQRLLTEATPPAPEPAPQPKKSFLDRILGR